MSTVLMLIVVIGTPALGPMQEALPNTHPSANNPYNGKGLQELFPLTLTGHDQVLHCVTACHTARSW